MTSVTADELISKMTIAAVEVYILGGEADDSEVGAFKNAIPLIEKAWELTDRQSDEALALIGKQHEAVQAADKDSERDIESVLDEKLLLDTPSGYEILAVIWGLIETAVRIDQREDREKIAYLINYLRDYWDLAEHIRFRRRRKTGTH
jgi:hypothetical protein